MVPQDIFLWYPLSNAERIIYYQFLKYILPFFFGIRSFYNHKNMCCGKGKNTMSFDRWVDVVHQLIWEWSWNSTSRRIFVFVTVIIEEKINKTPFRKIDDNRPNPAMHYGSILGMLRNDISPRDSILLHVKDISLKYIKRWVNDLPSPIYYQSALRRM